MGKITLDITELTCEAELIDISPREILYGIQALTRTFVQHLSNKMEENIPGHLEEAVASKVIFSFVRSVVADMIDIFKYEKIDENIDKQSLLEKVMDAFEEELFQ